RFRSAEAAPSTGDEWFTVDGHRLTLHLRARRADLEVHPEEILRHTPVTGFAPGLELRARVWDPQNRVHLTVDLAGNINTHRARQGANAQMSAPVEPAQRWRFDWMVGPRLEIPALHIAELGAQ